MGWRGKIEVIKDGGEGVLNGGFGEMKEMGNVLVGVSFLEFCEDEGVSVC